MLSDGNLRVSVAPNDILSLRQEIMSPVINNNGVAEANSTGVDVREDGSSYLDTITEEEEEYPSSDSFDSSENVTVQHLRSPLGGPGTPEADLLEACYFIGAPSGMGWCIGETDVYTHVPNYSTILMESSRSGMPPQAPSSPVRFGGSEFCDKDCQIDIIQYPPLPCQIYLDKRGSKSLPSVARQSNIHHLQPYMSSSNVCVINDIYSLTNSQAPSPTRTQLNDVAEWALSSPGVTTITDTACADSNFYGSPISFAVEQNSFSMHDAKTLDVPVRHNKMKRSPGVEGVSRLLERSTNLNNRTPEIDKPKSAGSASDVESYSITESFTSSSLSLSRQCSESPPMPSRPIYDYGTDETLLEIFMTPAEEGMVNVLQRKGDLAPSIAINSLGMSCVWRDTCEVALRKGTSSENKLGSFKEDSNLPFIDNEESYSEAWYITASQQFSWLDRAELANFDEIYLCDGKLAIA